MPMIRTEYWLAVNPNGTYMIFPSIPHRQKFQGFVGIKKCNDVEYKLVEKFYECWSLSESPMTDFSDTHVTDEENPYIKYKLHQVGEQILPALIDEELQGMTWQDEPVKIKIKFLKKETTNE